MIQQKWVNPATVPTPATGNSVLFLDATNGGALSFKTSDGAVVVAGNSSTGTVELETDEQLNDSHIGRLIMFHFNDQKARLTAVGNAVTGVKYAVTFSADAGVPVPQTATWVVDFADCAIGDWVSLDDLDGHSWDFTCVATPVMNLLTEFAIGNTPADTAANFAAFLTAHHADKVTVQGVDGTEVEFALDKLPNHIGAAGNNSAIIASSGSLSKYVNIVGTNNVLDNVSTPMFSFYDSNGAFVNLQNKLRVLFDAAPPSGMSVPKNGKYFPIGNGEALIGRLKVVLQTLLGTLFDFSTTSQAVGGVFSFTITAKEYGYFSIADFISGYFSTSEINNVFPMPELVKEPVIGLLVGFKDSKLIVDTSDTLNAILASSSYDTPDVTDNIDEVISEFFMRCLIPHNEGKLIPVSDAFTEDLNDAMKLYFLVQSKMYKAISKFSATSGTGSIGGDQNVLIQLIPSRKFFDVIGG